MPLLLTCHSRIPQYCFKTKAARITCPLCSLLELRQVEQAQGAEGTQVTVAVARPQNLTFQIALPIWAWAAIDRPAGHRRACREKGLGSVGSTLRGRPCIGLHSPLTPGPRPRRSERISGPHGDARGVWGAHEEVSCGAVAPLPSHPPLRSRGPGTLACVSPLPTRV